ncbi:hypothetical protein JCM8097_000338 [Rhodosporidiobolus ruineniae]
MAPKRRQTADEIISSLLAIHASGRPAELTIVSADPVYPPKTVPTMPVALVREQQQTPNIDLPTPRRLNRPSPAFAVAPIVSAAPIYPPAPTAAAPTRPVAAVQHSRPSASTVWSTARTLSTNSPSTPMTRRRTFPSAPTPPLLRVLPPTLPPPPRTTTRSPSAAPPRLLPPREPVLLRSSSLPPAHPLLLVPNKRLTGCVKRWVRDTGLLPADYVAAAGRMERGDIRIFLTSPHAAALFRRTLPHLLPTAELIQAPERMGVVVHFVPVEVDEQRAREALERWLRHIGNHAVEVERAWGRRERSKGREEEENAQVKELSGVLPSPAELAAALADAPQSTPVAPAAPSSSFPLRTPFPKPKPTAYPPVVGPSLNNSTPSRPSLPIPPSRNRAISVSSAPEPSTQRTMTPTVLASQSWSECEDEGPGPVPDFSVPAPARLLPAWRTFDSEEMSRLAKEGHESVDAWIEAEEAKRAKAEASGRVSETASPEPEERRGKKEAEEKLATFEEESILRRKEEKVKVLKPMKPITLPFPLSARTDESRDELDLLSTQ